MPIYLIRHTAPAVAAGICYGQSDVPLGTGFPDEVAEIRARISGLSEPRTVYTSPLERCHRLAVELFGPDVETDDRLKEIDFGDWELNSWPEIDRSALDSWGRSFVDTGPPGGESLRMLYDRVVSFLEDLDVLPGEAAAIVTHAGVIRCVWAHFTGTELQQMFRFDVGYGDVFVGAVGSGNPSIRKI